MNLSKHDKQLLDKAFSNKDKYSVVVDNDAVYLQDDSRKEDEEVGYWETFDQYGYHFIVSIFEYLGFKSDYV